MTIGSKNSGVKKKGGKRAKKGKKFVPETQATSRYLVYKEKDQLYLKVTGMLGDCRVKGQTEDGKEMTCMIRGKFKKRVWIKAGDIVLIGLREFEDEKADIIHKYTSNEAKQLVKKGEISQSMLGDMQDDEEEDGIDWHQQKDEEDQYQPVIDESDDESEDGLEGVQSVKGAKEDHTKNRHRYQQQRRPEPPQPPPQRVIKDIDEMSDEGEGEGNNNGNEPFDMDKALSDL